MPAPIPRYRLSVRVINELAWHNLFARNLFIVPTADELADHEPEFTVIDMPGFQANPDEDGTNSGTFIVVNFAARLIIIGGTAYGGEMKKSIFTILNYLLPQRGVLSMHCSANVGAEGDVALFFGLSGTGKTTLSTDPERPLIGDDEHGWSDTGIFNFEGGCYAKTIRLSAENEPEIYQTTRRFGTVLENLPLDPESRRLDLDSDEITENTRGAYPISHLQNVVPGGMAGHPRNIVLLAADAFGVLPPISRLTTEQAMYHFLLGYTARVAGTERGVTDPQATFSACFGAPFLPLPPPTYAAMLGERLERHQPRVWLVNTGWLGGPAGESDRVQLPHTRAMIRAALSGALDGVPDTVEPVFGLRVPTTCPDVPGDLLDSRGQWADPDRYDAQAVQAVQAFQAHRVACASLRLPAVRDHHRCDGVGRGAKKPVPGGGASGRPGACANPVARATSRNSTSCLSAAIIRVPISQEIPDQASQPTMLRTSESASPSTSASTNAVTNDDSWTESSATLLRTVLAGSGGSIR